MGDVEAKSGHGDLKWVLASYVGSIWGAKCRDRSNILGLDWGLATLGPVKVSGHYSSASWGKVGGP